MGRSRSFREALDASLDRLAAGASVSQCLYDYPEHARELRPLLEAALALLKAPCPEARPEAVSAGHLRMMAAVRTRQIRHGRREDNPGRLAARWEPETDLDAAGSNRRGAPRLLVMAGVAALILVLIGLGWLWQAADLSLVLSSGIFNPVEAVVVEADGMVLHLPSGTRTWRPVTVGQVLRAGDRLQTVGAGRARVAVGRSSAMALSGAAKVSMVAVPTRWQPRISPSVYQMAGEVRYLVADEGDVPTAKLGWGVSPVLAGPVSEAAARASAALYFDVRSPVLAVRAARAAFVMAVAHDGATAVAVDDGEVTVTAGDRVQVTHAGETAVVRIAGVADDAASDRVGGELQVLPGGSESLDEAGFGPADLGSAPSGPAGDVGDDAGLEEPADPDRAPEVPPGLEETDGVPPGQMPDGPDVDPGPPDSPPGLEDKDAPGVPPGLEDKGGEPPGQVDKDDEPSTPPGLEDKEVPGEPPGQVDKDDEPNAPPGLEDKGGEPPGQGQTPGDPGGEPGPPGSPPGQEDKGDTPPGQDPGHPGGGQGPPEGPPGQEDKDNDPAPPGQDRGRGPKP